MTYQANRLTPGLAIPDHDGIVNHYEEGLLTKVFYYTSYSGFSDIDNNSERTARLSSEDTGHAPHTGGNLVATLIMKYDGSKLASVQKI
jgi:hypothetical protein